MRTKSVVGDGISPERDVFSASELRIGERPVCDPAGWCVFSELSKLLNQEYALSAPCFWRGFGSPHARLRWTQVRRCDSRLRGKTPVCCTQVIRLASADAFAVAGGRCTGRAHRYKAKQGRRGKTALECRAYSHNSTFLGRRPDEKRIYFVTMAARCGNSSSITLLTDCGRVTADPEVIPKCLQSRISVCSPAGGPRRSNYRYPVFRELQIQALIAELLRTGFFDSGPDELPTRQKCPAGAGHDL
jgi:hypothetical protein